MAQSRKRLALAAATAAVGAGLAFAPMADAALASGPAPSDTPRVAESGWGAVDGLPGKSKAAAGDNIYYFKFAHSKKCAEVPGLSKTRGKGLDQWTCTGRGHHWWYLTEGPGSTVHVVNYNSKLCMNVKGGSTANKAPVVQWDCNNQNNGLWVLQYHSQYGQYRLWNAKSGKCVNVRGASTGNGADLIQYTCSDAANNRFWAID
ncbi:RICIN domain-containing protein [Streptomyces sp. NPDC058308]|uniref:RICIN domain-containing protein n=1 Tax=Streptomyces sp. NPDC058308 TaxID=3346440 RepID=UPI0036E04641